MATLQSTGLGSGLDVAALVTKLVNAEGAPKQQALTKAQTTVATKISAMGSLKGALGRVPEHAEPVEDGGGLQRSLGRVR